MGTIYYGGSATPIHIEDRALAHLKVVIAVKLRRGESFTLSWRHPDDQPRGRSTIWLHPSIPLRFVFDEPEPPEVDRDLLIVLQDWKLDGKGALSLPFGEPGGGRVGPLLSVNGALTPLVETQP